METRRRRRREKGLKEENPIKATNHGALKPWGFGGNGYCCKGKMGWIIPLCAQKRPRVLAL